MDVYIALLQYKSFFAITDIEIYSAALCITVSELKVILHYSAVTSKKKKKNTADTKFENLLSSVQNFFMYSCSYNAHILNLSVNNSVLVSFTAITV